MLTAASKTAFYKAAMRLVVSYGFTIWSGVSSIPERKYLRWSRSGNGRMSGTFRYLNSTKLYADADIKRIDVWMTELYLKTFQRFKSSKNIWIQELK